jgi:DNA-binding NarL/FixJ family response regulator
LRDRCRRPAGTRRQLEIAGLVAEELTNKQIADRLSLSERTVETHVTNILNKLGLHSRLQLSRWMAHANPRQQARVQY